ncbi:MAG: carboxyl-terminal processing protease, partial [Patescibacteria group bacterium]|nr:carboxyl-terminal processing protease [Patescibacteria group bacterium]
VSPISGSPAEKAGLKAGDVIIKIDGLDVTESVSLEYAVSKIKGPAGSEVVLRLKRGEETITVTVERAKIEVEYVEYKKLASGVPYVKISMFGEGTLRGFAEAATWIKKNGTDTDKLVIDLRNDPGGSLDEVAGILSYFVPKGEAVVKIRYRDSKSEIVSAGSDDSLSGRKIAILVNAGSASASEIMAGTIKDYLPKTVIVGEKTYGKGSVQNFVPYDDGSSIKYTIAKWFTGKTEIGIDGMGITPDIEVKSASGTVVETGDRALEKAEEALRSIR